MVCFGLGIMLQAQKQIKINTHESTHHTHKHAHTHTHTYTNCTQKLYTSYHSQTNTSTRTHIFVFSLSHTCEQTKKKNHTAHTHKQHANIKSWQPGLGFVRRRSGAIFPSSYRWIFFLSVKGVIF